MRRTGWAVLGSAATALGGAGLLVAEWKLAKRGPQLASTDFPHDGRVGGDGPTVRLVWLGDSSVTGAGASALEGTLPRLVAAALDRPVELVILAVSGSRVRDVLEQQLPGVGDAAPDVVVIGIGTNDVLYRTPLAEIRSDYDRILQGLPAGVPVVAVGPIDFGAVVRLMQPLRALTAFVGRRISHAIRDAADRAGVTFVDLIEATGPAMRRDPARLLSEDLFHPSDEGYRVLAGPIAAALAPVAGAVTPGGGR